MNTHEMLKELLLMKDHLDEGFKEIRETLNQMPLPDLNVDDPIVMQVKKHLMYFMKDMNTLMEEKIKNLNLGFERVLQRIMHQYMHILHEYIKSEKFYLINTEKVKIYKTIRKRLEIIEEKLKIKEEENNNEN